MERVFFDSSPATRRTASFNKCGMSGNDAESDWQLEGCCHESLVGPEKLWVNWSTAESGSRLLLLHVCLTSSSSSSEKPEGLTELQSIRSTHNIGHQH